TAGHAIAADRADARHVFGDASRVAGSQPRSVRTHARPLRRHPETFSGNARGPGRSTSPTEAKLVPMSAKEPTMSIEFFRTEDQRPLDADGFELPPWENPYFAIPPDDDLVEPTPDDVAWLAANSILPPPPISGGAPEPFEPSDQDWDDLFA